jgi:hypothetical protein
MKYTFLVGILFMSAEVFSQEFRVITITPSKEIPYLQYKDSLSAKELLSEIRRNGSWKGVAIDSVDGFVIHQLPRDRMKCLVPSRNNPAMSSKMVVPMRKSDVAPIPNAIQPQR